MLTLLGTKQTTLCDGLTRRDLLRLGALGAGGLTLTDLLGLQARGQARTTPKAVIMVYLYGGMPHLDMYDMKPNAPSEFRGEFQSIATNVPGCDICELMPLQAKIADKLAVVRNWEGRGGHNPHELLTGGLENDTRPAFGSVVSRLHGAIRHGVPQYVATSNGVRGPASYAGKANEACIANGDLMKNLTLGVPLEQLADRRSLLHSFDTLRQDLDATGRMAGFDSLNARALEMVTTNKVRDALDLNKEPEPVRAKYGRHTQWLQARRLVEAGVSVVSLEGQGDWDTHENNFTVMRRLMPEYDRAVSALVTDLYERGLDKDVALVVWSEFGRTPKINGKAGRDHWATGSVLLSGGGFKTGQFIGATDSRGEKAVGIPYRASHVHATLYSFLGISPTATIPDFTGRPRHLVDDARTIVEL